MKRGLDTMLFFAALLAAWQVLHLLIGADALASPLRTVQQAAALLGAPSFWGHVAATAEAYAWAVLISTLGGLALGLLIGLSRFASEVADPILTSLYAIPKVTLYPVVLLFFGLGLSAKVAFGTLHGIFPVMIFTIGGVRAIRPVVLKTARAMRLSSGQLIARVLLPGALPEIFSGLRIGVALALLGTLIGELFASDRGLGFMLIRGIERNEVDTIAALTLMLFSFAALLGVALLQLDRRLHHR